MGVVWLATIVIEDEAGSKVTLKHYLPATRYTFTQARDYVDFYVNALDAVIDGGVRRVALSQAVDLAGLRTVPGEDSDVEEKLAITFKTLDSDVVAGEVVPARKSKTWQNNIPTWRSALTLVWGDGRRVADQQLAEVQDFLNMILIPPQPHKAGACDDRGVRLSHVKKTLFTFSKSRKGT